MKKSVSKTANACTVSGFKRSLVSFFEYKNMKNVVGFTSTKSVNSQITVMTRSVIVDGLKTQYENDNFDPKGH